LVIPTSGFRSPADSILERVPSKAAERKSKMRATLGELHCEVCDLSETQATARFGVLTSDIFECHHTKPLHTLTGTTTTVWPTSLLYVRPAKPDGEHA
jgi:predicted HNH restriction endonuclease